MQQTKKYKKNTRNTAFLSSKTKKMSQYEKAATY